MGLVERFLSDSFVRARLLSPSAATKQRSLSRRQRWRNLSGAGLGIVTLAFHYR